MLPTISRDELGPERTDPPTITREALVNIYGVSQGYLGHLLREKKVPLPVRINGEILWYKDEVDASLSKIQKLLDRKRKSN